MLKSTESKCSCLISMYTKEEVSNLKSARPSATYSGISWVFKKRFLHHPIRILQILLPTDVYLNDFCPMAASDSLRPPRSTTCNSCKSPTHRRSYKPVMMYGVSTHCQCAPSSPRLHPKHTTSSLAPSSLIYILIDLRRVLLW